MPLVTLTVRGPKSTEFKNTVLDAVHAALVSSGVPPADKFQRVIELEEADFRFDPAYPDLQRTFLTEGQISVSLCKAGRITILTSLF